METFYKSYKYRIYPNDAQIELLSKHFGCVRFIYNLALQTKEMAYSGQKHNLSRYDLQKQLTELKQDLPWLKEVSIGSLQIALLQLDNAYKAFYKKKSKFPVYKSKHDKNTFACTNSISIKGDKLCIPKFQEGIKIIQHRNIKGNIKSATIIKTPTGKYFASILCKVEIELLPTNNNIVGIDLGLKTFAVLSDGKQYTSPKLLRKSLDRLAVLHRRSSKKKLGSNNRKKANLKIALLHERITNQRKQLLHNTSNEITNQFGVMCIEDLSIKNMVQNHKLSLSINDASWRLFIDMLAYKSKWKGRQLITIGRFDASTKICSNCGNKKDMPLGERVYNCECGLSMDRDLNAAINIKNLGILRTVEPVELPEISGAVKQELVGK